MNWEFHTFAPQRVQIKWPGKQSLLWERMLHSVRLCSHTAYKRFSSAHGSVYGFVSLCLLTVVLKSDYEDNRFNCIFYGKTSVFLAQELVVATHMSEFTKSHRWASFQLSLWIAASPLNMQPASRIWAQTDVEINLCSPLTIYIQYSCPRKG